MLRPILVDLQAVYGGGHIAQCFESRGQPRPDDISQNRSWISSHRRTVVFPRVRLIGATLPIDPTKSEIELSMNANLANDVEFYLRSIKQNPCPNGSRQNATDGRPGFSNNCSCVAPAHSALASDSLKSSTWKSICTGVQCGS